MPAVAVKYVAAVLEALKSVSPHTMREPAPVVVRLIDGALPVEFPLLLAPTDAMFENRRTV